MKVDLMTAGTPLPRVQQLARDAHRTGFSGLCFVESTRTAFLGATAAALAAPIDLCTGVAVAFARSPMVTAQIAWELADTSGGRFRLGLGTQVRAHIERRYSMQFEHPGPRMREYVLALRAIFRAFRGEEPLSFSGDFYSLSLFTKEWGPGPIHHDRIPIDIAAVNPWMLRMAGEVADGVHVHPLNSPTYLRETVLPNLAAGARTAGRDPSELTVIVPCFTAVGDTDEEIARHREQARQQVAFYGSTPNYAFIFDQLGFEGTTARLRERQKAKDFAGMAAAISDEVLDHFAVTGTWAELPGRIVERYGGVADRVVLYFAGLAWAQDPSSIERWGELARSVIACAAESR